MVHASSLLRPELQCYLLYVLDIGSWWENSPAIGGVLSRAVHLVWPSRSEKLHTPLAHLILHMVPLFYHFAQQPCAAAKHQPYGGTVSK